jgi:hypothetical protein
MGDFFITKRNYAQSILHLDSNLSPLNEDSSNNSNGAKEIWGTYFTYGAEIFGSYTNDDGKFFFIGEQKYNYRDSSWAARIEKVGSQNRFIMTQNGAVVKDFTYTPEEILDWDPYSDEEDDLLTMVCNIKNNPERLQTLLETYQAEQTKQ